MSWKINNPESRYVQSLESMTRPDILRLIVQVEIRLSGRLTQETHLVRTVAKLLKLLNRYHNTDLDCQVVCVREATEEEVERFQEIFDSMQHYELTTKDPIEPFK